MKHLRTFIILSLILSIGFLTLADPNGVTIVSNQTETPTPQSAASLTTAGGSFTTLILNATTQTLTWKAYVGNITGSLTLDDASNFSIYDWDLTTISGEVYASRNSTIDWSSIRCLQDSLLATEETQLNITTTKVDSINQTFNDTIHSSFYVGTTLIQNSTCRSVATYINDTAQAQNESADFQEVMLDDTSRVVYATLLESDVEGYSLETFDFQMIVAENPTVTASSTYYFWAELS